MPSPPGPMVDFVWRLSNIGSDSDLEYNYSMGRVLRASLVYGPILMLGITWDRHMR
jgi:hypothetical protein